MNPSLPPGTQDRRAAILGWLVVVACAAMIWNSIELPRTALDMRAGLRALHSTLGLVVVVLVAVRLWWWARGPKPRPPAGVPESSFAFNRAIVLALLLSFGVTGIIGFPYAWADGQEITLFGVHLPRLVEPSRELRGMLGYLHSAIAFYYLMLLAIWFAYGFYQQLRYRPGLARLLPGSRV